MKIKLALRLAPDGSTLYHFGMENNPEEHLRVIEGGKVDLKGGRGLFATWKVSSGKLELISED